MNPVKLRDKESRMEVPLSHVTRVPALAAMDPCHDLLASRAMRAVPMNASSRRSHCGG